MEDREKKSGTPEELAQRIAELRRKPKRGESRELVSALVLVFSLGFIFILNVYLGFLLGKWLEVRTGNIALLALGILLGVASGSYGAYAALKPFLKKMDEKK